VPFDAVKHDLHMLGVSAGGLTLGDSSSSIAPQIDCRFAIVDLRFATVHVNTLVSFVRPIKNKLPAM